MRLASIDPGNGWVKAFSSTQAAVFESVSAVEQGALKFDGLKMNGNKSPAVAIDFEGERYALGHAAYASGRHQVREMGRARVGSDAYRLLFAGALAQVVRQSSALAVVLSLPVKWYTGDRETARHAMAGSYTVGYDGRVCTYDIRPENLHIIPEGLGSLAYAIINQDGTIRDADLGRQTVALIDIGTRTTDYIYFDSLEIHPTRSDGQDETGMATVWAMTGEEISQRYGRDLSEHELDQAVNTGYFMDGPDQVPIHDISERAIQTLAATIEGKIKSMWENGRAVERILVTGGGAYHVYRYMDFAHKQLVEPGYFANCEGAYRFGLLQQFADE